MSSEESVRHRSLFQFFGEVHPKSHFDPKQNPRVTIRRKRGDVEIELNGASIKITTFADYGDFTDVLNETHNFVQAVLAAMTLRTGVPLVLVINEWTEQPLSPNPSGEERRPVRGVVYSQNPNPGPAPFNIFMTSLAEGFGWAADLDENYYLRRAILDFNFALQHPLDDIPIYLYRAIESAIHYFRGDHNLIKALNVGKEVKFIKRLANESQSGIHSRHAAKTGVARHLTHDEVRELVEDTRKVLIQFQIYLSVKRARDSAPH